VYRGFGEGEGAEVSYRMAGPVTYAYKQREKSDGTKDIKLLNAGQNPPDGVLIAYELAEPVAGELTVTILDGDDREIRRFSSTRAKQPDENRDQDTESGPGAERTDAAEVGEGSESSGRCGGGYRRTEADPEHGGRHPSLRLELPLRERDADSWGQVGGVHHSGATGSHPARIARD